MPCGLPPGAPCSAGVVKYCERSWLAAGVPASGVPVVADAGVAAPESVGGFSTAAGGEVGAEVAAGFTACGAYAEVPLLVAPWIAVCNVERLGALAP